MTFQGIVKGGKLEFEPPLGFPEGTLVRVEIFAEQAAVQQQGMPTKPGQTREEWLEAWRKVAREVTSSWKSPKSALEILSEIRR